MIVDGIGGDQRGAGGARRPAQEGVKAISTTGGHAIANGNEASSWDGAPERCEQATQAFGEVDAIANNARRPG